MVPAFREYAHVCDDLKLPAIISCKRRPAVSVAHFAMHEGRCETCCVESLANIACMVDGRAKHDSLPIGGLRLPVVDDRICHRRLVHDGVDLAHIEVGRLLPDGLELFLNTDVDDEGAWMHQMTSRDQFANADLVADIAEDFPQTLLVATIGGSCDAEDFDGAVALNRPFNDAPVAVSNGVMGFIDHQQVESRHRLEVSRAAQRRRHGESRLSGP